MDGEGVPGGGPGKGDCEGGWGGRGVPTNRTGGQTQFWGEDGVLIESQAVPDWADTIKVRKHQKVTRDLRYLAGI